MEKDEQYLTDSQLHVVGVVIRAASALSLIGCSYILWHHVQHYRKRHGANVTQTMVVILSILDFFYAFPKIFMRAFIHHKVACTIQGMVLGLVGLMSLVWSCCMAHSVYCRVVNRESELQVRSRLRWYLAVTIVPASIGILVQLALDMFGDAIFYCWIQDRSWHFLCLYLWVILSIVYVCIALLVTQAHIMRRARLEGNIEAHESSSLIILKLRLCIMAFVILWVPSAVFRMLGEFVGSANFSLAILMQATTCSQGFVTGVIYGGLLTRCTTWCNQPARKSSRAPLSSPNVICHDEESADRVHDLPVDVFVSTFNLGEGKTSISDITHWIPLGCDLYVIGVQECLQLQKLRDQLKKHIESQGEKYAQYGQEIGRTNTHLGYHGYIALTVFVCKQNVNSGAFFMPSSALQEVNCGKSLVFGRASNKGAVGIAFRYFDSSFAFVTCHLSSDTKGRSKVLKRNRDAEDLLRQLQLNVDDVGFEFSLMHHHSFVLGDLNYRLTQRGASAEDILKLVTQAQQDGVAMNNTRKRSWRWSASFLQRLSSSRWVGGRSTDLEKGLMADTSTRYSFGEHSEFPTTSESVCSRGMSLSSFLLWRDVINHDELTHWMGSKQVFFGYREAPIAFPPSYRRVRGTVIPMEAPADMSDTQRYYTTTLTNGESRVPSYTDRILYRSHVGVENRLTCSKYGVCEDVSISDHKPVVSLFHVAVNRNWKPFQKPVINSLLSLQRICDIPGVHKCSVSLSLRSVLWDSDSESPADSLRHIDLPSLSSRLTRREHSAVSLAFPLPCEDIFSEQRKLHDLANTMSGGVYHQEESTSPLQSNVTSVSWTEFERTGLVHSTLARLHDTMHVAVKIEAGSTCLGQGVLALKYEWLQAAMQAHDNETAKTDASYPFEVPLSVGGMLTGKLRGAIRLHFRRTGGSPSTNTGSSSGFV